MPDEPVRKYSLYPPGTPIEEIHPAFRGCSWDEFVDILWARWPRVKPTGHELDHKPIAGPRDRYGMKAAIPYRNNVGKEGHHA